MQSPRAGDTRRPRTLHTSRSFTRLESPHRSNPASPTRIRASTIQTPVIKSIPELAHPLGAVGRGGDIFESTDDQDGQVDNDSPSSAQPELQHPETFEQLPIEIRSYAERFLKSLSAKAHTAPLTIDAIAALFQDFYAQVESPIATHVAALAARLSRGKSPAASTSTMGSTVIKTRSRANSKTDKDAPAEGEQQMLTASEVVDRRKTRRLLELKQLALEEAVERGICERVYDRIYRHRSTDDEERDASLRSKTAALALVGIGLKELHVDVPAANDAAAGRDDGVEKESQIHQLLIPARESLQRMDDEHYPFGKLQCLTAAHQSIVETLSQLFPSSSSADEVLPTLIYTLITSPPDLINVVSNLHFIQRFRAATKVDGEAAYCLVNLEAAISFLETVDLSSLRADEAPEGPPKSSSGPPTPTTDKLATDKLITDKLAIRPPEPRAISPSLTPQSAVASDIGLGISTEARLVPSPTPSNSSMRPTQTNHRRLSSLIQAQADRIEAGRENFLSHADQAMDSINATLEGSFKFLFGRLNEQQSDGHESLMNMPRTLEDARKLVSPHVGDEDGSLAPPGEDDARSTSGRSSITEQESDGVEDPLNSKTDNKMLEMIGGRRNLRERSADSTRSAGSSKRVAFVDKSGTVAEKAAPAITQLASAGDSVGNLMSSLNPLSRFGVPGFPRFGRSVSGPGATTPPIGKSNQLDSVPEKAKPATIAEAASPPVQQEADLNAVEALAMLKKTRPPVRRFLEVEDAKELKLGEVDSLLREYKRLAKVIGEAINY